MSNPSIEPEESSRPQMMRILDLIPFEDQVLLLQILEMRGEMMMKREGEQEQRMVMSKVAAPADPLVEKKSGPLTGNGGSLPGAERKNVGVEEDGGYYD